MSERVSPRILLDVLQERFPDSSKTTLRKMLQADRVRVNGNTERRNVQLAVKFIF